MTVAAPGSVEQIRINGVPPRLPGPPEQGHYDRIAQLAAHRFNMPMALLSFVDDSRLRVKSRIGLPVAEGTLESVLSAYTMLEDGALQIADIALDGRFADASVIAGNAALRFFAGVPLVLASGHLAGVLAILDIEPHPALLAAGLADLAGFAALAVDEIELRSRAAREVRAEARLALLERVDLALIAAPDHAAGIVAMLKALADHTGADIIMFRPIGNAATSCGGCDAHIAVDPAFEPLCAGLGTLGERAIAGAGGGVAMADIADLAEICQIDCALLRDHGIRSLFVVPFHPADPALSLFFLYRTSQPLVAAMAAEMNEIMPYLRRSLQRRATEDELRRAKDKAERDSRTKLEFLAIMSHEFRTPLNAVIGFSETMTLGMFGPLSPRYHDYARYIFRSGRHLLRLVGDILDLAKIEAGTFELQQSWVDLAELCLSCTQLLSQRAEKGQIILKLESDRHLSPIHVDEVRMKQIVLNLLANAVKFTPAGGRVTLATERRGYGVALSVADTGIGMRPEDIPLAQESFRQIENSLTRSHEGAGLGLPLAKHLTELHGGTLHIDSTPGRGTTVTVELPREVLRRETARWPA
jgi:signal transduction histidine kinase